MATVKDSNLDLSASELVEYIRDLEYKHMCEAKLAQAKYISSVKAKDILEDIDVINNRIEEFEDKFNDEFLTEIKQCILGGKQ